MNNYSTNTDGVKIITTYEGLSLKSYLCPAGVWTIGYGHTDGVKRGDTITREQAESMLLDDLVLFEQAVRNGLEIEVNENQFSALVAFVYNVGAGAYEKSTLLRKINAGDFVGASKEFARWNKAGGRVLPGLVKRRQAEMELFLKPC